VSRAGLGIEAAQAILAENFAPWMRPAGGALAAHGTTTYALL
jgi:hypothetical protein